MLLVTDLFINLIDDWIFQIEFYSYEYGDEISQIEIWLLYTDYGFEKHFQARIHPKPVTNTVSQWNYHRIHVFPRHQPYQVK